MRETHSLQFAPFRLDLGSEQLWCGGEARPLTRKAFAALRYLVVHAGQLVTKDELLDAVLFLGSEFVQFRHQLPISQTNPSSFPKFEHHHFKKADVINTVDTAETVGLFIMLRMALSFVVRCYEGATFWEVPLRIGGKGCSEWRSN